MRSRVAGLVDCGAVAGEALGDLLSGFVPDERLGVLVPGLDPRSYVGGEFFGVAVSGALQFLCGERGEPPFHKVHPRPVRRSEMEVESAVAEQPPLNLGRFMGAEIVENDVNVEVGGYFTVDFVQEGDEVVLVVAGAGIGDDRAPGGIEGRG